jgi:2-hydroxy-6-oxonona-2,4-dienedioate hydrolase
MPEYTSMWTELTGVSFSQGFLDANGIRTRYLAAGDSALPGLILLHGIGGHAEAYVRNLGPHGSHFHTVAIDMIGHGWTDKPDVSMEIDAYVAHLLAVLDFLKLDRAHISGESLGGWVAARLAIEHPDRVNRLVLNTTGGSTANPAVMARIKELTLRAATDPSWDFVRTRLEWLMHDKQDVFDDLIAVRKNIYSAPGAAESMRRVLVLQDMEVRVRNLLQPQDWAKIEAETLVLWTTHDPTNGVPEGQRIASLIPHSRFVVMPDCGHWPQFEDAETFNKIHIDFLKNA